MSAPNFKPQLQIKGAPGKLSSPPLAWDFLGGEAYQEAKKMKPPVGVVRLGPRSRGDRSPDTRPLILAPQTRVTTINNAGFWTRTRGATGNSAKLKTLPSAFAGGAALQFIDNALPNEWEFKSPAFLNVNEGVGLRAFVSDVDKGESSAKGHVAYARWGKPGQGFKLQVKDGNIELLHLSREWNETEEHDLHILWQISEPTSPEIAQMETLVAKLYDVSNGLSFEGGFGRDEWRGLGWAMLIIPEVRSSDQSGAVHFLLEGGAGAVVDLAQAGDFIGADGVGRPPVGNLWEATSLYIGATGGAMDWQILNVYYNSTGTLEWGPYKTLYGTEGFEGLETQVRTSGGNGTSATLELETIDELRFSIKGALATTDTRYTPFVHALGARIPNGARIVGDDEVTFDTLALEKDDDPIMSVGLRVDENGIRSASITMRDVSGNATGGKALDYFSGFVTTLKLGAAPWITNGMLIRPRANNMKRLATIPESGTPLRGGNNTSNSDTTIEMELDQGEWTCSDILCDPPIKGDGLRLGELFRRLYRRVGYTDAEIAGISPNVGIRLPRPRIGESWCQVIDASTSISGATSSLMDRFGAGLRHGRRANGVWFLESVPTAVKYPFTSNGLLNDPHLIRGGTRHILLRPLVWEIDTADYYTVFKVTGGPPGRRITRTFVNEAAVTLAAGGIVHPRYRGGHKYYPELVDEGLTDLPAVLFALRSLKWRYGRPGRVAQAESYLHEDLLAWDRVTGDGILAEVQSWSAEVDSRNPLMQMRFREVVNV